MVPELQATVEGNLEVDIKPDQDVAIIHNLKEDVIAKLEIAVADNMEIEKIPDQDEAAVPTNMKLLHLNSN